MITRKLLEDNDIQRDWQCLQDWRKGEAIELKLLQDPSDSENMEFAYQSGVDTDGESIWEHSKSITVVLVSIKVGKSIYGNTTYLIKGLLNGDYNLPVKVFGSSKIPNCVWAAQLAEQLLKLLAEQSATEYPWRITINLQSLGDWHVALQSWTKNPDTDELSKDLFRQKMELDGKRLGGVRWRGKVVKR